LGGNGVALPDAFFGFFEKEAGLGCWAALFGYASYDHVPFVGAATDAEIVSGAYNATWPCPGAVGFDFSTADGFGAERPSFKKSRGPQPFVNAYFFADVFYFFGPHGLRSLQVTAS
jgi:hypothetical protein